MLMAATQAPLVSASKVYKTFAPVRPNADVPPGQWVLDGVSLTIRKGESVGLVGESGSGKSTLGRIILGLLPPTRGSVDYDGVDVWGAPERERRAMRARCQIVFQDPLGALNPRRTIAESIELPLINARWARPSRTARVDELLCRVGLDPRHKNRYPHQFSGGQCQRVVIARAIALDPDFLFLDEPVSALDVSVQAQILNLLEDIRAALGLTCLFVSHDLKIVRHFCERTAVMFHGQLVEMGASEAIFDAPLHPYTRALRAAVLDVRGAAPLAGAGDTPDGDAHVANAAGCRYAPRCPLRMDVCANFAPPLERIAADHWLACHAAAEIAGPPCTFPEFFKEVEPAE